MQRLSGSGSLGIASMGHWLLSAFTIVIDPMHFTLCATRLYAFAGVFIPYIHHTVALTAQSQTLGPAFCCSAPNSNALLKGVKRTALPFGGHCTCRGLVRVKRSGSARGAPCFRSAAFRRHTQEPFPNVAFFCLGPLCSPSTMPYDTRYPSQAFRRLGKKSCHVWLVTALPSLD